ncbi:hypothetical protein TD95_003748 [Thielaviopsis punctulata]|uniref:NDT80 domain-containing protein n=1 Tax=Thielaviopsis punctulata TaxID=72032 RepID=A0A0F4ZI82_9PEZI|nr:hypothetical protein TD95_003748 [Thielaviopsis punctulata]
MDYIDMQPQRYTQDTSSLAIAATPVAQSHLFQPTVLNPNSQYSPESSSFYTSQALYPGLDTRSRGGSSSTSSSGMPHAHRATNTLPHPTTREQYSSATPSFRRSSEHPTRSPSFPGSSLRRHHNSPPITSPINAYTAPMNMDPSQYNTGKPQQYPPLEPLTSLGTLQYTENPSTPITLDINGSIDKGFFLSPEGEWTCYRRNYFSCACSYSLTPYYQNNTIQFTKTGSSQPYQVFGFSMCISAVVADNDGQVIELVQHTPKRDKGPVVKPSKVTLLPRIPSNHHPLGGLYSSHDARPYGDGFPNPQTSSGNYQTEHTFERIQFKQATANNGKRRAAQQYYHLLIEVWANVGDQSPENYIKVAYKKSAKMIVRGRSPGHYQAERRGSTSSGPGSGTGGLAGYHNGSMMDTGFGHAGMMGAPYGSFEPRSNLHYSPTRHHQAHHQATIPGEAIISAEDSKAIEVTKGYQYYPSTIYESQQESKPGVEMFSHQEQRSDGDASMASAAAAAAAAGHYDPVGPRGNDGSGTGLPSMLSPGPLVANRRCGQFEAKAKSEGCYPTMLNSAGMNMS